MARHQTPINYLDFSAIQYMESFLFKKRQELVSVAVFACTREATSYIVDTSLVAEESFNYFCVLHNISTETKSKKIYTKNTAKLHEACGLLKLDAQELMAHTRQDKAINAFHFFFFSHL